LEKARAKKEDSLVPIKRQSSLVEKIQRDRANLEDFIKDVIVNSMVEKAETVGESLNVCREIQKKFEMRPVMKFVYPLLLQF
jgi:hypothetical protein